MSVNQRAYAVETLVRSRGAVFDITISIEYGKKWKLWTQHLFSWNLQRKHNEN